MEKAREEVARLYGNRLRIRVCGVCIQHNKILLLSHRGIGNTDVFWCPPGGGVQFEESTLEALQREFVEETGLEVEVENLLFVNEFIQSPLHALELFFEVKIVGGSPHLGSDPEMTDANQIIQEMKWMTFDEIKKYPKNEVHAMFSYCESLDDIYALKGYLGHSPAKIQTIQNKIQIVFEN